jgi:5'-nucleotidase
MANLLFQKSLLNLLKIQQQWPEDKDNILQAVGLKYQWDSDAPVGSRILEVIDREGNVLETNKEYEVSFNTLMGLE